MSLKGILFEEIKKSYPIMITINRVEQIAKERPAKMSACERRLRELCQGQDAKIEPVYKDKSYIVGYIYKLEPYQSKLL